jgi:hypothetical protein
MLRQSQVSKKGPGLTRTCTPNSLEHRTTKLSLTLDKNERAKAMIFQTHCCTINWGFSFCWYWLRERLTLRVFSHQTNLTRTLKKMLKMVLAFIVPNEINNATNWLTKKEVYKLAKSKRELPDKVLGCLITLVLSLQSLWWQQYFAMLPSEI